MQQVTDALTHFFGITQNWVSYLLAVAGLGALTMAIIQALKDTTPICRWYQRAQMRRWLASHAKVATANLRISPDVKEAESQLLLLATDYDANSFYSLEIEKLCGLWNAAIQIVMDYPDKYAALFICMAARASHQDANKMLHRDLPDPLPPDAEARLSTEDQRARSVRRQTFADARKRVTHQIQRGIDSFQINTSYRWTWALRFASYCLSIAIALIALGISGNIAVFFKSIPAAVIAGFLAPVARDLLAVIEKLRDPS